MAFSSTLTNSGQQEMCGYCWPGDTRMWWLCAEGLIRELDINAHRGRVGTKSLLAWEAPSVSHEHWRRPRANSVIYLCFPVWLLGHCAQLGVCLQVDNGTTPVLLIINHYLGESFLLLSCHQEGSLIVNKCSLWRKRVELETPEGESEQPHLPSFLEQRVIHC